MFTTIVLAPTVSAFERYVRYLERDKHIGYWDKTRNSVRYGSTRYVYIRNGIDNLRGLIPGRVVQLRNWQLSFKDDELEDVEIQLQLWTAIYKTSVDYTPFF